MEKKLYVGSLSYDTTDEALKDLFSQAGNVESASVIIDKLSGRSKGFGFVEMSTTDEAQKAIEMFNGTEFEGRSITVDEARPMQPKKPFRSSFGGGGGGDRRGGFGGGRSRGGYDQ